MKKLARLLIAATCVLAIGQVWAQGTVSSPTIRGTDEVVGKIGLGYTSQNAPIGVRMWFAPNMGFDANLGLVINGEEFNPEDPADPQVTADFALDAAFLYAFVQSDNSFLYARASFNYDRRWAQGEADNGDNINSSVNAFTLGGWVGMEFFLTGLGFPELGLQAAVGLGVRIVSGPENQDPVDDAFDWSLGSLSTGLNLVGSATLGFHYYF